MSLLSTSLLGTQFTNPLLNASGVWCRDKVELDALNASQAGSFVTKSCTLEPRTGNPEPRYFSTPMGSICRRKSQTSSPRRMRPAPP